MNDIERAIEAHEKKKRKRGGKALLIILVFGLLGFGALYGCACMMDPAGMCP